VIPRRLKRVNIFVLSQGKNKFIDTTLFMPPSQGKLLGFISCYAKCYITMISKVQHSW
jgi:hypothetical protein